MNLFAKTNIYIHCLIMRKYYQQTPSLFTFLLLSREFQDPIVVYFYWIFFRECMSYTRHDPDRQNRDRDPDPNLKNHLRSDRDRIFTIARSFGRSFYL